MKHLLTKPLKTGDLIGVIYSNFIHLAFYCEGIHGNYFWDHWAIKHADELLEKGLKKAFNPRKGFLNTNADRRMIKINFEDVDPSIPKYNEIKLAMDILRKRQIITY